MCLVRMITGNAALKATQLVYNIKLGHVRWARPPILMLLWIHIYRFMEFNIYVLLTLQSVCFLFSLDRMTKNHNTSLDSIMWNICFCSALHSGCTHEWCCIYDWRKSGWYGQKYMVMIVIQWTMQSIRTEISF